MVQEICGLIKADTENIAEMLLSDLGSLTCTEVIGKTSNDVNANQYDAFMDNEGYLTFFEDYDLETLKEKSGGKYLYEFSAFYESYEDVG